MPVTAAAPTAKRKPLGEVLVERCVVDEEQLAHVLEEQNKCEHQKLLGELVVELGYATEEQIVEVLADDYGVPYAKVSPRLADPQVIPILPRELIERHNVLPLFLVDGVLTVAVHEPANVFLVEELERESGFEVQVVAATAANIEATLQTYLPNDKAFVIDQIIDAVDPGDLTVVEELGEDIGDLEAAAGDSPVVKLVNYLIYAAVEEGVSDIHIEPQEKTLRVRFRIDGRLTERLRPPRRMHAAVVSRIKIMSGLDIAERRLPQDGGIHVNLDRRPIDLRVSTMPGRYGEKVVMRVIDNEKAQFSLEKLGFGVETLKAWRSCFHRPNGIVLVTGPTGSGKSTTLYASLAEVADPGTNVSTVEDPVEYTLPGINQFQVNEKAGFTFSMALRSLLRQDPDVIMVGEIRDGETARLATQAALTGHLVLSTLHTNDAPSAAVRLFNLGIEPYLVGATLGGVLAQRLIRKLCDHCKNTVAAPPNVTRQLNELLGRAPEHVCLPVGCEKCRDTGYLGRLGIYELLVPDEQLVDALSRGLSLAELRELARGRGMTTLRHDGAAKIAAGVTAYEEICRVTT